MFIDTHCHLNFHAFAGGDAKIVKRAQEQSVIKIIIPGTDIETSQMAIDIALRNEACFATIGLHPHHVQKYIGSIEALQQDLDIIESMLSREKVVAVGEIGLDRHTYRTSKYGPEVVVSDEYFDFQLVALQKQIELAITHDRSVVIHNRESTGDILQFFTSLSKPQCDALRGRLVLHCCEPDMRLLDFATEHAFYIGVDGDVTYDTEKMDFISKVPLSMLVLETDAPYILPEPMRSAKKYPNLPAYIPLIAQSVADLKYVSVAEVGEQTTTNATNLYHLPK